jgi:hypothetical protein
MRRFLRDNALTLFFLALMVAALAGQALSGHAEFNQQQYQDAFSWTGYITSADFWNRTFQNWQSEFLAIASMTALAIYLRQRGSPESKPVGSAHPSTGVEG